MLGVSGGRFVAGVWRRQALAFAFHHQHLLDDERVGAVEWRHRVEDYQKCLVVPSYLGTYS